MTLENDHIVSLKKGHYLAPKYSASNLGDLLIGITKYDMPVETGVWHSHEKSLISFVLYGNNIEHRSKTKTIERTSGSLNFYYANEIHKNVYNQFPSKHISVEIDNNFLINYGYSETEVELAVKKNSDAIFTFVKLMHEATINDLNSKSAVEMLFLAFMENSLGTNNELQFPHWIKSVRDILNDRWNENVSLTELSEIVNIHPTTISKYFRKYFKCTLGEYVRKLKVRHSIEFLNSSNYSLTETAYLCGFSDQSHFTKVFKFYTGFLPKNYSKTL